MKGQFFVIGALLLASLFFLGLPFTGFMIAPASDDLSRLSVNLEKEFPKALNLALDAGDVERLGDFSGFVSSQVRQRNAGFGNAWVVTRPEGGGVNVTIGNYLGTTATIMINISNNVQIILMQDSTMESVTFPGIGEQFTMRVTFPENERELLLQRGKANLYSFFRLSRGDELIRKDVVA